LTHDRDGDSGPGGGRDEARQLAALRRYAVLDTSEEEAFDRLCALARDVLGTPVAAVALVDAEREWSKARLGLEVHEWPRAWAFYPHLPDGGAVAGEVYVLPDAPYRLLLCFMEAAVDQSGGRGARSTATGENSAGRAVFCAGARGGRAQSQGGQGLRGEENLQDRRLGPLKIQRRRIRSRSRSAFGRSSLITNRAR
jgi:hypothetical protein